MNTSLSPANLSDIDFKRLGPPPGTRVLVVGGCGGLGRAVVRAALDTDLRVAVFDQSRSIAESPPPDGVELTVALDATVESDVQQAFLKIDEAWNGLDGLVNFAGIAPDMTPVDRLTGDRFAKILDASLRSAFLVSSAAIPRLRVAEGGAIVNTSSSLAVRVMPGYGPYSAAKCGIIALTKVIAIENAPRIRANTIAPGAIRTPIQSGGTGRDPADGPPPPNRVNLEAIANQTPLQRVGIPDEVAAPVLFLLGPASRYITGQTFHINGGTVTP